MTEAKLPIAEKIEEREVEVRELVTQVPTKTEIKYKDGFEEKTAGFEIFDRLPVVTGFSWGFESGTMSFKWKGESESDEVVRGRISDFMRSLDVKYPGVIHMLGVLEGVQEQIQAVDSSDLNDGEDETVTKANFIYTLDPNLAIVIRPADCPISTVYGKTKDGKDIAGFVHSSGVSVNAGIPRLAIDHLILHEDLDPESIRIGITPGISRENYSITEENTIEKINFPIVERNWKDYIDPKKTGSDKERRHIEILGATIMQYLEAGIDPSQIEAYDVDTYGAHQKRVGFSHRLYETQKESGNPINPGRFMVAIQLGK